MAQVLELDRTDRALLRALTANARASGAALASDARHRGVDGVAAAAQAADQRRDPRLPRRPRTRSRSARRVQALIAIRLVKHAREEIEAFRRAAPSLPGVLSLFHMAGADDFLLHVVARDAAELREFVLAHLTGHPAVAHTETNLIFEHADGDGWEQLIG